ncbi:MAG: heparan-alpha-glucosaminide N-acetyltransferase domain-containing protein [Ginsengibacter sp.]
MLTVNESRGISLARGFIVFLIAPIHCVMVFSTEDVKQGTLGFVMAFFAENPGAHLFMFLMGVFVVFSRDKPYSTILKRFVLLLVSGWLLNTFKFVIPHLLHLLPENFYSDNHIVQDRYTAYRLLFINDILQFASFAYLTCALIRKTTFPIFICILSGLAILIFSPLMWDRGNTGSLLVNVFLDLLGGFPPKTYFPIFPWLFHCLAGMVFALLLQKKMLDHTIFVSSGIMLILSGYFISTFEPAAWQITFFRAGPGGTLLHTGVTILWISLFVRLSKDVGNNILFRFFEWCSRYITSIYLIQWCIIMWLVLCVGYEKSGLLQSLLLILFTSLVSLSIVNSVTKKNTKND